MQLKLDTLVDAYRDLENKRRRGGSSSRGIDKDRTGRLFDSDQQIAESIVTRLKTKAIKTTSKK